MNTPPRRPDLAALTERLQQLNGDLLQARDDLRAVNGTGVAGDGLVVATVSGDGSLLDLHLDPSVIDADDPERLAALVIDAVNEANRSLFEARTRRVASIAGQAQNLGAGFRPRGEGPAR